MREDRKYSICEWVERRQEGCPGMSGRGSAWPLHEGSDPSTLLRTGPSTGSGRAAHCWHSWDRIHAAVTVASILTCNIFFIDANIADRFSIVGLPELESIRWRLLLGL